MINFFFQFLYYIFLCRVRIYYYIWSAFIITLLTSKSLCSLFFIFSFSSNFLNLDRCNTYLQLLLLTTSFHLVFLCCFFQFYLSYFWIIFLLDHMPSDPSYQASSMNFSLIIYNHLYFTFSKLFFFVSLNYSHVRYYCL